MKKTFIFAILIKSSLAVNLFPYHSINNRLNSQSQKNIDLYKLLTTNICHNDSGVKTPKKIAITTKHYNITTLMNSYSTLTLNQSHLFLAQQKPMAKSPAQCNDATDNVARQQLFSAKIALAIFDNDRKYKVLISDFSGQNIQTIVSSKAPITSLSWNASNTSLAYVSYENGKPIIYIQNIYTAKRYIVANFDGSNSSPAFDGNSLLVSLSKDYGTHIYQIDLHNYTAQKTAQPLVSTDSIETEADIGNGNLIFTSNKNSKPQIYLKSKNTAQAKQISIGLNNTTGRISGDGSKILYIHGSRGRYDLMYYNLKTGVTRKIDAGKILSGSFAADNTTIAYIKNNQVVIYNSNYKNTAVMANLRAREFFDVKWSK